MNDSVAGLLEEPNASQRRGRVLIVDDEDVIASTLQEFLSGENFEVATAADACQALELAQAFEPEIALCDVQLPGLDGLELLEKLLKIRPDTLVLMITAYATVENAVAAFHRGAHDYLMKPVIFEELLTKLDRLMNYRRVLLENQALRRALHRPVNLETLVGNSTRMMAVKSLIRKAGPTRSNVLITGESGTGKELVARALHAIGQEPEAPFLAVNCAAIPNELLENQLFGYVKGAFTGADRDRAGLFAAAGRGTVFLDEIGELPLVTQAKLLRAIETKEVLPVGATKSVSIGARVLAATNKDLGCEVAAGRFRPDLYYRLNVLSVELPPLRDRREDIPDLINVLLARHAERLGRPVARVSNPIVRALSSATWKGNVRELDNALERAVILADGPVLTAGDFHLDIAKDMIDRQEADSDDLREALDDFEKAHIRRVLERAGGDKREAAKRLGLGLSSLYRKLDDTGGVSERA
jgi:DNA-binding NtrC family response regulator